MGFKIKIFPETKREKREVLLAIASGVALGAAYPPLPFYLFAFVAFIPYFFALKNRDTLASVNRLTYVFAFAFNLITLYWVGSWTKEADPFLMLSGAVLLFFNPLLFLIPSSLFYVAKKTYGENFAFFSLPFFWIFYEYIYGITEFRFPWLTLGNSQAYFTPFIQIADTIGVFGISLLILYVNIFLFFGLKEKFTTRNASINYKYIGVAVLLFISPLFYGVLKYGEKLNGKEITVGIIQPNLNPWKKWDAGSLDEQIDLYFALSRRALDEGAEILVFPETALPVYLTAPSNRKALQRIRQFVDSANVPLLTGMPDFNVFPPSKAPPHAKSFSNSERKYTTYNAAYLFVPHEREIQEYHKTLLVPFGEKVPYVEYVPFIGDLLKWEVGISSWNVGEGAKVLSFVYDGDSVKIGAAICIESIYPEYISQFVELGAQALFVVTNDSWYGKSSGPYQHEAIAILRAVENNRYVVRAANGGVSCVINPHGKIEAETKLFTRTVLTKKITLLREKTFYTSHPKPIPIFATIFSLGIFFLYFLRKKKK